MGKKGEMDFLIVCGTVYNFGIVFFLSYPFLKYLYSDRFSFPESYCFRL